MPVPVGATAKQQKQSNWDIKNDNRDASNREDITSNNNDATNS
jgi:hypothetical protein